MAHKKSDCILKITLTEEEYAEVKKRPRGWVRNLIQREMGVPSEKKSVEKNVESQPKYSACEGSIIQEAARLNPHLCVECGHVKVAGRCINKECKRKGKI